MQFLQSTFDGIIARHTIPPDGKNPLPPWNKTQRGLRRRLLPLELRRTTGHPQSDLAYNHADWVRTNILNPG